MSNDYFAPIAPLMDTDAYKLDHRRQYPEGTTKVLSNYTNRGSRIERVTHVVHFGLQAFLQDWATNAWVPFFEADEDTVCDLYEEFVLSVNSQNDAGTDHIRALHKLGYLPLKFSGLPEGTLVPLRVPSFTVENTHPDFFWLVNYIETVMSSSVWQPSTSATNAYYFRQLLNKWALKTTGSTEGVEWQGHDFSFRGMAGREAAAASGAGHLLSFKGSDNLNALHWVEKNYSDDVYTQLTPSERVAFDKNGSLPRRLDGRVAENGQVLGSVPATEHSVMCAGGNDEGNERDTFKRLLNLYPSGIVSVVSDTWDLWNVLTDIVPSLHDEIMARDGKLVIRPDSGDPVEILTGTTASLYGVREAADKGVIELLWEEFGGTINEQGYKVLDPHIGAIYGDSITYERAEQIFHRLAAKGFASTNVVLGVGSYTYQYVTRDTFASAVKATWVEIAGEGRAIAKDPITDNGTKKSAKGRLAVLADPEDGLILVDGFLGAQAERFGASELQTVWEDGEFVRKQSFGSIRDVLDNN